MGKKFLRKETFVRGLHKTTRPQDITFVLETQPTMRKTDNPFAGRVMKHTIMEVRLCHDYQGEVNDRRLLEGKEADFQAKPLAWGQHVLTEADENGKQEKTPLIEHKGELYIQCQVLKAGTPTYLLDGAPAEGDELAKIKSFIPERSDSKSQGVDDEVIVRTFKLVSVIALVVDGKTFPLI